MNEVYRTRRQWFIRDFMIQTQRPASELATFLEAFDSCEIGAVQEAQPEDIPSKPEKPEPVVVHNEVTKNVHPRAKMVMAEFEGRNTYYGSIADAAHALYCSRSKLSRALKLGKTIINGISVITVTPEEVFQMRKEEHKED